MCFTPTRQTCLIQASPEPHEKCHLSELLKVDITFTHFHFWVLGDPSGKDVTDIKPWHILQSLQLTQITQTMSCTDSKRSSNVTKKNQKILDNYSSILHTSQLPSANLSSNTIYYCHIYCNIKQKCSIELAYS